MFPKIFVCFSFSPLLLCVYLYFNTGLLIMAAKFEFEDRQDTSAARVLFQEGLRTNSSSQKLWLEVLLIIIIYITIVIIFLFSIIEWN